MTASTSHTLPVRRCPQPAEVLAARLHALLSAHPYELAGSVVELAPTPQGVELRLDGVDGQSLWAALCRLDEQP